MAIPITIEDSQFEQVVIQSDIPVLVDFWATWCRPCAMIAPILDELDGEYSGRIKFTRLDVDKNPKTSSQYHVMSIPTLLIFSKGEPVANIVGFRPKAELKRNLDAVLVTKNEHGL